MFDAMIMTDTGDAAQAKALRTAAYEFAVNAGVGEAANAHLAPDLVDLWLADRMETCIDLVGKGKPLDPGGSVLARAGAALTLAAAGNREEAVEGAESLAADIIRSPASQGTAALALVTSVLANSQDEELLASARSMLDKRGRSFFIVGAFVASLGPTDRYRAELAPTAEEARRHRLAAVELARTSGSRLWEAVTHRDLAVHHGDEEAMTKLIDLTKGSDLEILVPGDG
jgi:hypothetical protein